MKRALPIILFTFSLFLCIKATAEPANEGWAIYEQGNFGKALDILRPLAEAGLVPEPNEIERALEGHARSQALLGFMYETDRSVPQDPIEAAQWYRLAAEQGIVIAQYSLAQMYYDGRGMPRSKAEAKHWYERAAQQGDAAAQYNLALLFATGDGVMRDLVMAHMWLDLAAARGHEMAGGSLIQIAARLTATQIALARQMADDWQAISER